MSDQPSLKERAFAARRLAEETSALATQQTQAKYRAETIQGLVRAWAGLGVVVCACQVREDSRGQFYFDHEGYRLGLGHYGAPAIYHEHERYWNELSRPESNEETLELLADAMLRIDDWRERHRHWLAERGEGPCDPEKCPTCEVDLRGAVAS